MRRLLLAALSLAIVLMAAAAAGGHTDARGTFQTLRAGTDLGLHIEGSATINVSDEGTVVTAEVRGLKPGKIYAAHLHGASCSGDNPGGGHYKNELTGKSKPPNELWLSSTDDPTAGIKADEHGVAHGRGSADWVPRPDTRLSVVIHNIPEGGDTSGGPKIACADLPVERRSDHPGDSGDWQNQGND
jgi:Cu/Zn superoxide dismutase